MVCSGVEVRVDDRCDFFGAALRDDCVDQPVGSAVRDVVVGESELEQILDVVAQAQVELGVVAGGRLGAHRVGVDHAGEFGRDELVGAEPFPRGARVLDRDEVGVGAGGAVTRELEHLRRERREAAPVTWRGRRGGGEAGARSTPNGR